MGSPLRKSARFYPLQTCSLVCGLVAISTALACLAKSFFQKLISKNVNLPGLFFSTPSRYSTYLRIVLASWIVEKKVNVEYVLPKRETLEQQRGEPILTAGDVPRNLKNSQPLNASTSLKGSTSDLENKSRF